MTLLLQPRLASIPQLKQEGISVLDQNTDTPALRLLLLNLMPKKLEAEYQFLRLLGSAGIPLSVDFARVTSRLSSHADNTYLQENYLTFQDIRQQNYDGFLITGTPVELMKFEDVDFWEEVQQYLEWTNTHVRSSLHCCWGAQAAMYYHYGIGKKILSEKLFGIYPYQIQKTDHPLMAQFPGTYTIPQARFSSVDESKVLHHPHLEVLARNNSKGIDICTSKDSLRHIFVFGHFEYERTTMIAEYHRDKEKGLHLKVPENYFPNDDSEKKPYFTWNQDAKQFHKNWLQLLANTLPSAM